MQLVLWWRVPIVIGILIFQQLSYVNQRIWIVFKKLQNSRYSSYILRNNICKYLSLLRLWGADHDFTLEEVLSEIAFFRGESYHTVHECGSEDSTAACFYSNFSYYAQLVRSSCVDSIRSCEWNNKPFECCKYFQRMETELGICYAINSMQAG